MRLIFVEINPTIASYKISTSTIYLLKNRFFIFQLMAVVHEITHHLVMNITSNDLFIRNMDLIIHFFTLPTEREDALNFIKLKKLFFDKEKRNKSFFTALLK